MTAHRSPMFPSWLILFIVLQMMSTFHLLPLKHAVRSKEAAVPSTSTKSNSIELLKKVFAHRRRVINTHRPSVTAASTARMVSTTICLKRNFLPTATNHHALLNGSTALSSFSKKTNTLALVFLYGFICTLFLVLMFTVLLRQQITVAYFKLPCLTTKRSRDSTPLSYSSLHGQFIAAKEFSVDQLHEIYMQKHALEDLAFDNEFQSIPDFPALSCTAASQAVVAAKNRFVNILPIDATRVLLSPLNDDPTSDYINANYISGYNHPKKFIATQGPKPNTCVDFWRMVWEFQVQSIVMLTNTIEGVSGINKCHQYWPELNQTITYGSYEITGVARECFCDFIQRSFEVIHISNREELSPSSSTTVADDASSLNSRSDKDQSRLIVQYHYTQWKDMNVPVRSHTLLQLIRQLNTQTGRQQYPIVVHCTAGVGRTGTFIAIDAMIERIEREGMVNVYDFIAQMRHERHLMVQTVKQYVFIHRSLLEHYLFGNTRIEASNFRSLYAGGKKNNHVELVLEYNKLGLLPVEDVSHHDAHSEENLERNRHLGIVPYDHNLVRLSRILGHPYINASLIDGYSRQTSCIITQDPLPGTIEEFWRIFIEYESNCIVQFHTMSESFLPCAVYYPNDVGVTMHIGSIGTVTLVKKETIDEKIVFRQLLLNEKREDRSKIIDHFDYLLPISDNDNCDIDPIQPTLFQHNLIDLLKHIHQDRYITMHGGNGGPCCSIFCLCRILLDQLKYEQAVDIFQSVRALQRQRPAMITSFEQYQHLYAMVNHYLEEFPNLTAIQPSFSLNTSIYDNELLTSDLS